MIDKGVNADADYPHIILLAEDDVGDRNLAKTLAMSWAPKV